MPVGTCLSKTLGCLNVLGALVIQSSGVLEHGKMGSRAGLAWLSSCKVVRVECSCCFCSCLWALVSMPPCTSITHGSFFLSAWCAYISDYCQVFSSAFYLYFVCLMRVFLRKSAECRDLCALFPLWNYPLSERQIYQERSFQESCWD